MSVSVFEESFRTRLHVELDQNLPDANAERRVLDALTRDAGRDGVAPRRGRLRPGLGSAVVAALVILVVGGALTISLMLGRKLAIPGGLLPAASGAPAPVGQSPQATPSACTGDALSARVLDRSNGVGTSGGDIALTNIGVAACAIDGYVGVSALINGHVAQVGVTHIAAGSLIMEGRTPAAPTRTITLVPGYAAFVAFEVATMPAGARLCPDPAALLITPPQGSRYAVLNNWPLPLCSHDGVAQWISVAPVSATPYFGSRG
jgi:hypothetical protein